MSADDYGPWEPFTLEEVQSAFANAPFRWWISGGRALELYLGRSWRAHDDTDVGVLRRDVPQLRTVTGSWDVQVAAAGVLTSWLGQDLDSTMHQNNLWCRESSRQPWKLDVTIGEGNDECWIYRRDPQVAVTWDLAVLESVEGFPFLAPEIQILYKSKDPRPKDEIDARQVIPALNARRREWLCGHLSSEHPWQRILKSSERRSTDNPDLEPS